MSIGKIHTYPGNPRAAKAFIAAKYNNLVLEEALINFGTDNKSPAFLKKFPLGKVPAFEGADGFTLYESSAIAHYVASYVDGSELLGVSKKEQARVAQFVAMADNELGPINMAWIYPIMGYGTFDAAATEKAKVNMKKFLDGLNQLLATQTYLVTEAVSLADIVMVCHMTHLVKMVLDAEFLAPYKNVVRWFTTCVNQPHFKAVLGEPEFAKKALVFGDKLPEAKPQPKAAASPKKDAKPAKQAKPEIEDLEAIAAAEQEKPKEKNPLDLLPKSTFVLDEWKRMYSNNETRPTAIDWFWKNYDPTGYSIWKCDYKYNSELTQIFMSSNLVGGFYQRLDRARKYAFGSMLILGEDKNNVITGHFVFRGHGIPFEVSDAADYDSYTFTRINDKDQKAREDFNAVIAWDDKIYGKPCADGKVFK